jgi:hypothetical protein
MTTLSIGLIGGALMVYISFAVTSCSKNDYWDWSKLKVGDDISNKYLLFTQDKPWEAQIDYENDSNILTMSNEGRLNFISDGVYFSLEGNHEPIAFVSWNNPSEISFPGGQKCSLGYWWRFPSNAGEITKINLDTYSQSFNQYLKTILIIDSQPN